MNTMAAANNLVECIHTISCSDQKFIKCLICEIMCLSQNTLPCVYMCMYTSLQVQSEPMYIKVATINDYSMDSVIHQIILCKS